MEPEDFELLDKAYEILTDVDHYVIRALAERYINEKKSLNFEDVKILSAYIIINCV